MAWKLARNAMLETLSQYDDDLMVAYIEDATITEEQIRKVLRKAIVPSDDEIARNPRCRSAKLRVAEKL